MHGVETRLTLVHNGGVRQGRISLNRFVEVCSTTPAKMFGLFPRKGTIAVGSDADLVIWDPEKRYELSHKNLHMRADYAAYEGKTVIGAPSHVFSRGELLVENDKFLARPGRAPYHVGSAIHDQAAYRRLSERAGADPAEAYFPAYRRPAAVAADG